MYYIIALSNTMKHEKFVSLWRPNNAGYCYSQQNAGVYPEPKEGYHDSEANMPILISEAEKVMIEGKYDGELRMMIPNCEPVWQKLNVKMTKNGLTRIKP